MMLIVLLRPRFRCPRILLLQNFTHSIHQSKTQGQSKFKDKRNRFTFIERSRKEFVVIFNPPQIFKESIGIVMLIYMAYNPLTS